MDSKDIISLLISLGVKDKDTLLQIINKLGLDPKGEDPEGGNEEGEGDDKSINIRKGKNSLQSRLSKLFPDLAKARGTYYYRQTDKQGDQGKIISKTLLLWLLS